MPENYIIAIEIGTGSVKAAAAVAEDRSATLLALECERLNHSVRYGRVLNVEEVSNSLCRAIDNLSNSPEVAPRAIVGAYVGVGGRSLHTQHVKAHLVLPEEQEITVDIIERLKDQAINEVPDSLTLLRVIPLRFTIDGVSTQRPKGTYGTKVAGEFTVIVCNPNNTRQLERVVSDRLGLDICGWVVRPLAIARTVLTPEDAQPGCMVVDMGAETTTVTIVKDSNVQYINTIPIGSDHITNDLAGGLGVTAQMAEEIKMSQGTAMPDNSPEETQEQAEINNYVSARAEEIVANVLAHIEYAGFTADDLRAGIVLTGRGSRLRSMGSLLESRSHLRVRQASLPSWMHVADTDINPLDNVDIISCVADGARQQASRHGSVCVEMPDDVIDEKVEVEVEKPRVVVKEEVKADTPADRPMTFKIDEEEKPAPKPAPKPTELDDKDVLKDDDQVEREQQQRRMREERRAREAEERRRQEAEKAARREAERRERERRAAAIEQDVEANGEDEVPEKDGYFMRFGSYVVDFLFNNKKHNQEGTDL